MKFDRADSALAGSAGRRKIETVDEEACNLKRYDQCGPARVHGNWGANRARLGRSLCLVLRRWFLQRRWQFEKPVHDPRGRL